MDVNAQRLAVSRTTANAFKRALHALIIANALDARTFQLVQRESEGLRWRCARV